ncbi:MAG: rhomboid family intramembrane serine protease [Candidatus Thiodiazotropha sp.]|jgi:membrane associated rhomboid family serine protease
MIILPLDRSFDWRNPPLVTFVLIAINCLCFFVWQGGENERFIQALEYYQDSGLAQLEYTEFVHYSEASNSETAEEIGISDHYDSMTRFYIMRSNTEFYRALTNNELINPNSEDYVDWKEKRDQFNNLLKQVTYLEYGLKTARPDWQSLVAHMFLHADFMHLFGNMFFLVAVGMLVELTLGRWSFLLSYLIVGLGSALFYILIAEASYTPGIGASGAVSGVMGMYSVLYWMRKIKFFYFLFVYFDYVRLPAIALLPLWIGNELYQIMAYPDSNINYLAHLGGFISGGAIALLLKQFSPSYNMQVYDGRENENRFKMRLNSALEHCEAQNYRRALPILKSLFNEQPDNRQLVYAYFEASKLYPDSGGFHQVCQHVLQLPDTDPATNQLVLEVFDSYTRLAQPKPRIGSKALCQVVKRLISVDRGREAEQLMISLLKRGGRCLEHTYLLLDLAQQAEKRGNKQKGDFFRKLINPAP